MSSTHRRDNFLKLENIPDEQSVLSTPHIDKIDPKLDSSSLLTRPTRCLPSVLRQSIELLTKVTTTRQTRGNTEINREENYYCIGSDLRIGRKNRASRANQLETRDRQREREQEKKNGAEQTEKNNQQLERDESSISHLEVLLTANQPKDR